MKTAVLIVAVVEVHGNVKPARVRELVAAACRCGTSGESIGDTVTGGLPMGQGCYGVELFTLEEN